MLSKYYQQVAEKWYAKIDKVEVINCNFNLTQFPVQFQAFVELLLKYNSFKQLNRVRGVRVGDT